MYTIFLSKETLLVSLVMIPNIVRYLGHGRSLWTNWRRNKFLDILSLKNFKGNQNFYKGYKSQFRLISTNKPNRTEEEKKFDYMKVVNNRKEPQKKLTSSSPKDQALKLKS